MNIVILGQGAIGLLWYRYLQQLHLVKNTITVKIRSSISKPASGQTFTFTDLNGLSESRELHYADNSDIQKCDYLLVCVKSYQVKEALSSLLPYLKSHTSIILSHNGMGTLAEIPQQLTAKNPILAMLTTHGCLRTQAHHIRHTGLGYSDIGLIAGQLAATQAKILTARLNSALPGVAWTADITSKQWAKLAINCVINPLTAINQLKNGQILSEKFTKKISLILAELIEVAACEAVFLNQFDLEKTVKTVALATSNNISSMRCDVLAGKKTEIDHINGYIHRLGKQYNIATPNNTALWLQVNAMQLVPKQIAP